jgi:hypothetical protein
LSFRRCSSGSRVSGGPFVEWPFAIYKIKLHRSGPRVAPMELEDSWSCRRFYKRAAPMALSIPIPIHPMHPTNPSSDVPTALARKYGLEGLKGDQERM